jgi:hypothetical protein
MSDASFEPWSFQNALPDMTNPYRSLDHTIYPDQCFSLDAVWGIHPVSSRDEPHFSPPYAQSLPRSSLLQWPSTIAGGTENMEEIDEFGRYLVLGER